MPKYPVLGNRTRRAPSVGIATELQIWDLSGVEKDDLTDIHAQIARQELGREKRRGNLLNINTFVDNRQFKREEEVKLGGKISYQDIADMADVMLFAQQQLVSLTPIGDTGFLHKSYRWILNRAGGVGNQVLAMGVEVPSLRVGDTLTLSTNMRYAKYVEFGARKRKGTFMFRKTVTRCRRRFGQAFIFQHVLLQAKDVPPSYSGKLNQRGGQAYSSEYYKQRWAVSYPAIKIKIKKGVYFGN